MQQHLTEMYQPEYVQDEGLRFQHRILTLTSSQRALFKDPESCHSSDQPNSTSDSGWSFRSHVPDEQDQPNQPHEDSGTGQHWFDELAQSSVHGVKNISETDSKCFRTLWAVVLIGSLTGLTGQLKYLVENFYKQPTSTSVNSDVPQHFAPLYYCPYGWASRAKMDMYNITYNEYLYLQSLYLDNLKNAATAMNSGGLTLEDRETAEAGIKAKLESEIFNRSIDKMLLELSYNVTDLVDELDEDSISATMVITMRGPCLKLVQNKTYSSLTVTTALFSALFKQPRDTALSSPYGSADMILMGGLAETVYPTGEAILVWDKHYTVKASYTHITHVNRWETPCHTWATHRGLVNCTWNCINKAACEANNRCSFYIPGMGQRFDDLCSLYHLKDFQPSAPVNKLHCLNVPDLGSVITNCTDFCDFPCDRITFELTAIPYGSREPDQNYSITVISFADPLSRFHMQENLIYDTPTMISNVGGAIGLWCGASILSFIEIVYSFSCRPVVQRIRKMRAK